MGIWLLDWRRGRVTGWAGLVAGFWFWACAEKGVALRGVVAEEEELGATLGGAGACFFVPVNTCAVHVISFVYTYTVEKYRQGRCSGHRTT